MNEGMHAGSRSLQSTPRINSSLGTWLREVTRDYSLLIKFHDFSSFVGLRSYNLDILVSVFG